MMPSFASGRKHNIIQEFIAYKFYEKISPYPLKKNSVVEIDSQVKKKSNRS